jgi:hypothetical protein
MKGWRTRSFPQKRFHHYRALGTAGKSGVAASFSYGEKDYLLGGSLIWQLFRVMYRATKQPIDGLALLFGYCWAAIRRIKRPISLELMRFHRREQLKKLRAIFGTLLRFKKVDNFRAVTSRTKQTIEDTIGETPNSQHPTANKIEGRRRKMDDGGQSSELRNRMSEATGLK